MTFDLADYSLGYAAEVYVESWPSCKMVFLWYPIGLVAVASVVQLGSVLCEVWTELLSFDGLSCL